MDTEQEYLKYLADRDATNAESKKKNQKANAKSTASIRSVLKKFGIETPNYLPYSFNFAYNGFDVNIVNQDTRLILNAHRCDLSELEKDMLRDLTFLENSHPKLAASIKIDLNYRHYIANKKGDLHAFIHGLHQATH